MSIAGLTESMAVVLTATDVDTLRAVLITSLAVSFVMYARVRLVTGGTLTPTWFVFLMLEQRWGAIVATIIVTALTVLIMRGLILPRWAASKAWQASLTVMIGVAVNGIAAILIPAFRTGNDPAALDFLIAVGLYVTPGLIAYDILRQGTLKTTIAIGTVTAVSTVLTLPVIALLVRLAQGGSAIVILGEGRVPPGLWWLGTVVAVLVTVMFRLGPAWRAGGFLAGLFAYEALTPTSLALAVGFALLTYAAVRLLSSRVLLTGRQRFQMSLLFGGLFSWFGLYWFTQFGYEPAIIANGYPLEPLLIVGLLASDFGRKETRIVPTILGMLAVIAAVAGAMWFATNVAYGPAIAVAVLASIFGIWLIGEKKRFRAYVMPAITLGCTMGASVPSLAMSSGTPHAPLPGAHQSGLPSRGSASASSSSSSGMPALNRSNSSLDT